GDARRDAPRAAAGVPGPGFRRRARCLHAAGSLLGRIRRREAPAARAPRSGACGTHLYIADARPERALEACRNGIDPNAAGAKQSTRMSRTRTLVLAIIALLLPALASAAQEPKPTNAVYILPFVSAPGAGDPDLFAGVGVQNLLENMLVADGDCKRAG